MMNNNNTGNKNGKNVNYVLIIHLHRQQYKAGHSAELPSEIQQTESQARTQLPTGSGQGSTDATHTSAEQPTKNNINKKYISMQRGYPDMCGLLDGLRHLEALCYERCEGHGTANGLP